jgi:hypothetical protein
VILKKVFQSHSTDGRIFTVIVDMPEKKTAELPRPVQWTPVAAIIPPAPLPPRPRRVHITEFSPKPVASGTPSAGYYAAAPAAMPAPYAPAPQVPTAARPAIATQAYVAALPQPPAPAPVQPTAAAGIEPEAWARDGKQVVFTIAVVEDVSGSFNEFPKLRDGLLMVSDSEATLAAMRIMEKQKLVKRISAPRLTCAVGEQATLSIESAREAATGETETDSLTLNVQGRNPTPGIDGMEMYIETATQISRGQQVRDLRIGYQIEEGQTAVIKTRHQPRPFQTEDEHPVYIVVTPKLVK